ncbi:hypothetical protein Poli38472_004554 [Pythium oligandrum]|uniref:BAR domain-containing protein n=1 Tax=Pythium oligandrum TaxID=41045 RepID=A0A8K1CAG5_PYTOL|nr:hypothetical protein Poli38472_004554 [Pythium oligandrum]|eukprot:TMW59485.1 hypothetical protein Poli38472_004554 [Pythium oligandrum]
MASWIRNMKDGSKRIKDEIVRSMGVGGDECMDPVLEYRCQRFNKYNDNLEKLARAMTHYIETSQAQAQASVQLMHAFSAFFETQMQDATPEDDDYAQMRSLAQSALRLEEIEQSLRTNIHDAAHEMQLNHVSRSIHQVRRSNAALQKQLQSLKQRLIDYDSLRRSAESYKKNPPEYERMQQRVSAAEATLVSMTNEINTEMNAVESRRSIDMKNELLTVVACQLFVHTRTRDHYEQLLPLLPGLARPLLQVAEYARGRQRLNPGESDTVGVVSYTGEASRSVVDVPLQYHQKLATTDPASVHPIQSTQFADMHFAEKLALSTYGRRQ